MPRAAIAAKQAKFTLEKLHAQLGGRILDNKAEGKRLAQAMKHVEAVLKLLDPAYSVRAISVRRRQPNQLFKRGTILRHALDAMRTASKPLTAREVALRMVEASKIKGASPGSIRVLTGGVQSSLRNYADRGLVVRGDGMPARWSVPKA